VNLIVSRAAAADIERLRAFLFGRNPTAAERATATLLAAIQSLQTFPDRGRPAGAGGRQLVVPFGRSSYVIDYRHDAARQEVVVLRIWHGREARE
jgi:plasmid stabilization system protein ParE